MKFKTKYLIKYGLPYEHIVSDKLVKHTRWSVVHEIVFEHEGKYYQTKYNSPATELQDEEPWYVDELECPEVQQVERTVKVWEPVSE